MQSTKITPQIGAPAPNSTVFDSEGTPLHLQNLWQESGNGLALIFVRHFGCQFCREHIAKLKQFAPQIEASGIRVIAVGNGTPAQAGEFFRDMATPFPILTDPSGESQTAYGLIRAANTAIFHPKELLGGFRALTKGFLPRRPQGDGMQLAGQFLIDPAGTILLAERANMISEILNPEHLLEAAKSPARS